MTIRPVGLVYLRQSSDFSKQLLLTQVVTVDCRNHGESPHTLEMDYHVMSEDIDLLLEDLNIDSAVVLGHSMGGKVAMTLALTQVCLPIPCTSYTYKYFTSLNRLLDLCIHE